MPCGLYCFYMTFKTHLCSQDTKPLTRQQEIWNSTSYIVGIGNVLHWFFQIWLVFCCLRPVQFPPVEYLESNCMHSAHVAGGFVCPLEFIWRWNSGKLFLDFECTFPSCCQELPPCPPEGRLHSCVERQLNHGSFCSPGPWQSLIWSSPLEFNVVLITLIAFTFNFRNIII